MNNDQNKISERLDAAIKYVEVAQTELAFDNVVMLQELQNNVGEICNEINSLPIGDSSSFREQLTTLAEKMQTLEVDLRAKKIEVEREIKIAGKNKNAAAAYEKAKSHSSGGDEA
jgi:hypothetical protein